MTINPESLCAGLTRAIGKHRFSATAIAKEMGLPRSTVWGWLKKVRDSEQTDVVLDEPEAQTPATFKEMRELDVLRSKFWNELKIEKARREDAERELTEALAREEVAGTFSSVVPAHFNTKEYPSDTKSPATAIICASDWHSEENVQKDMVNGLNEFNLDICRKRVEKLFTKAVYLTKFSRNICDIQDAVLWLGGDHINGYIHEELQEGNFLGPAEASLFVAELVTGGIDHLLKEGGFQHIRVVCNQGNHGRSTTRMRIATGYRSSWEYLAFNNIAFNYRNEPRVSFVIPRGYFAYLGIQGYTARFHHGDSIRYAGGVGGISIPVNKAIASWNEGRRADLDFFGHWHQYLNEWNWLCNGALVGYDTYALSIKAKYQPPTQTFVVIDRNRGKTLALPIFVEEDGYGEGVTDQI